MAKITKPQNQEVEVEIVPEDQENVQEETTTETTNKPKVKGKPRAPRTVKPGETLYVAVDSDFLRELAYFMLSELSDDEKQKNHKNVANNFNELKYFRSLIEQGILKIIIPTTVYQECKNSSGCEEFIKRYGIIPKIDHNNFKAYATDMTNLAYAYCFEEVDINGRKMTAMHPQYVASVGKVVPTNDAFIMAEATMLGLCLITLNEKDFIQTMYNRVGARKGEFDDFNDIVQAITTINKNYGYVYDSRFNSNLYTSARPFSPEKFMEINKGSVNLNKFICPKPLIIEDGTIIERER